ncbi:PREDICTED: uncharacterized protein LOC108553026 [Eufriesea mexicana]|uniref:uncharacterized protein LOC108553026 n=1 Tax=Eufriesea mexicana TaxID=516756 RepID=UPI00083C396D|nr:PREDICTED: uncharacterized protein LOC108553026 [Eufriesea mexicana]
MQCNRCTPASSWFPGPGQGTAIKAYRVAPQIRSVFPCTAQEKSPTMKFVIVLFAAMAVASAYPGIIPYSAPVHAPEVHQVLQIPQQASIPAPHPQPLNIKIPHVPTVKIPYHGPKVVQPHLIGVEHYVEPEIKIVKAAPISHHPWD